MEQPRSQPNPAVQHAAATSGNEDYDANAPEPTYPGIDVDVIWINIYAGPDTTFKTFRRLSSGPLEQLLVQFGKVVKAGVLEQVVSVNASKHIFCVVVACRKPTDEIMVWVWTVG